MGYNTGVLSHVKKFVLTAIGVVLILAGIVGSFLPVVPGVALMLLGLTIMGKEAIVLDPVKRWLEKRRAARSVTRSAKE